MLHNFCSACGARTEFALCNKCDAKREAWHDARQAHLDAQAGHAAAHARRDALRAMVR